MMSSGEIRFLSDFKPARLPAVFALAIMLAACGGGGGGGGGGQTPGVTTITISGTLSDVVTAPKLKPGGGFGPMGAITWVNALIEIIDSSGNVITTATASGTGSFVVNVPPGPDYFIRASIGNLVLKAVAPSSTTNQTVTVDPTSTAIVKILGEIAGNPNIGDAGADVSGSLPTGTVGSTVNSFQDSPLVDVIAGAIAADVEDNYDPSGTAPPVGSAGTAGDSEAAAIAGAQSDTTSPTTTATPAGGTYPSTQSVTLACDDGAGSGCYATGTYYTTDGSDPTTSSTVYSGVITINSDTTLKFFSVDIAGNAESIKSEDYVVIQTFTIGGTVSGSVLTNWLWLDLNGVAQTSVSQLGSFVFPTIHTNGYDYVVTVQTSPPGQTCTVTNGSGTITGANVTNISVNCVTNPTGTYSVGGNVSGLSGTGLVLLNNGADNLSVTSNGSYTFITTIADGAAYSVTISSQPTGQTCSVIGGASASGTINGANVPNVDITCVTNQSDTYTVGGSVSGLTGILVLQNFYGDDLERRFNGVFTFATAIADGANYSVTVLSQPTGQTCNVTNESGTISGADVTNISVTCTDNPFYAVGGGVSGLADGETVVLQNNGMDDETVTTDGSFTFTTPIANGAFYSVTVLTQPTGQNCTVTNSFGMISGGPVTNVTVTCADISVPGKVAVWGDPSGGKISDFLAGRGLTVDNVTGDAEAYNPQISGEYIAWLENRDGKYDIYLYRESTETTTRATTRFQDNPWGTYYRAPQQINDGYIVWEDYRNGSWDVYAYEISTGTEFPVATGPAWQDEPRIAGDYIVWTDERNGNDDVYAYRISTGTETRITTSTAAQRTPVISGDYIAWKDNRNGSWDIYAYRISTGADFRVTTASSSASNFLIQIEGDYIVWQEYRNGSWDIYAYQISTSTEFPVATISSENQSNPELYGNYVVWRDERSGSPEIYYAMLSGASAAEQLFTPPASSSSSLPWYQDKGGYISWYDNRNGSSELWGYQMSTGAERLLLASPLNKLDMRIDGDYIAWLDRRDGETNRHIYSGRISTGTETKVTADRQDYTFLIANITDYSVILFGDAGASSAVMPLFDAADSAGVNMLSIGTVPDRSSSNLYGLPMMIQAYGWFGLFWMDGPWYDVPPGSPMEIDATAAGSGHAIFNGIDTSSTISLESGTDIEESVIFDTDTSDPASPADWTVLAQLGPNMEYSKITLPPYISGGPDTIVEFTTPNGTRVILDGSTTSSRLYDYWTSVRWDLLYNEVVYLAQSGATYSVGGAVSGLIGNGLVLQNNGGGDETITSDGAFTFATPIADGAAYSVTVSAQPTGQTCTITNGSGTISGANVTNVTVTCATNAYTVGGTVSGLAGGETVVLQNNGGGNETITSDGAFTFATPIADGAAYSVTVSTQPSGQTCTITNGSGTISGVDVTNVTVTCTASGPYSVGGTVTGMVGSGLVLQNNGGDSLAIDANGVFTFGTKLIDGAGYNVTVSAEPSGESCTVTSGSGTISGADVTNIQVSCTVV